MSHGSTRNSPDEPRKCSEKPGRPRNTPVEPRSEKSGDLPGIYQDVSYSFKHPGRTRIEPELPGTPRIYYGFATQIHGLPTDYLGSNRSSPDRRSVAFRRPIRESVTGPEERLNPTLHINVKSILFLNSDFEYMKLSTP